MIPPSKAKIRKSSCVVGKTLVFRNANVNDAQFILSLRTDLEKNRYLSQVSGDITDQQAWLATYAESEDQAYFIIEYQSIPIGTVRLYDQQGNSFSWGSWILANNRPSHAALESALMVYAYAVDHLGFMASHFDVRKGNERVWQFHERFGARRIFENLLEYQYQIGLDDIHSARKKYHRYLAEISSVEFI